MLALNRLRKENEILRNAKTAVVISSADSDVAVLHRGRAGRTSLAIAVNASADQTASLGRDTMAAMLQGGEAARLNTDGATSALPGPKIQFLAGEVIMLNMTESLPITTPPVPVGLSVARIAIEAISPKVDEGQFPVRRTPWRHR